MARQIAAIRYWKDSNSCLHSYRSHFIFTGRDPSLEVAIFGKMIFHDLLEIE